MVEGVGESEVGLVEGLSDVGEDESEVGVGVGVVPGGVSVLAPLPPVVGDGSELSCWLPAPPPPVDELLSCRRNRYAEALGCTFPLPVRGTARILTEYPQKHQVS